MTGLAPQGKVCVIDDDELVRATVAALLKAEGFAVLEASDGDRALALIGEHAPALIITDIMMPNRDGIETLREAKRRFPATPILVMSGSVVSPDVDFLKLARKLGADAHIKKPFEQAAFMNCVQDLLRSAG
jgi:CheY-like chemotaxis protein